MSKNLFTLTREGQVVVMSLALPDAMDPVEFDRLNQTLLSTIDAERANVWVIDLAKVTYMSSATLGLMVNLRQRAKTAGGKLFLCGLSPRMADIFHACSMERLFTIHKTRADALRSAGN